MYLLLCTTNIQIHCNQTLTNSITIIIKNDFMNLVFMKTGQCTIYSIYILPYLLFSHLYT
jgi:hypothetical protein